MPKRKLTFILTMLLSVFAVNFWLHQCGYAQDEQPSNSAQQTQTEQAKTEQAKTEQAKTDAPKVQPTETEQPQQDPPASGELPQEKMLLDVSMKMIDGKEVNLKKYQGKVVLVVNVASKCGFAGQYKPLQAIHKEYSKHGFEVIAFPCNQFGKQEPHDEPAINKFCSEKFGIEFDLYSKTHVKGKSQAEFFKRLTSIELLPAGKGDIRWNFEKFLIGKDGKAIARYRSHVSPDSEVIVLKIKEALGIMPDPELKAEPADSEKAKDAKNDAGQKGGAVDGESDAARKPDAKTETKTETKTGSAKKKLNRP